MKELKAFHRYHQNETIVVCGCGESLNDFTEPERFITIGVNDVGRKFQPNYLVVVNPKNQFSGDRFRYVENSRAKYIFTQMDLGLKHPNVVKFQLGKPGGTDFSNPNVLNYTNNSPYIALCLAIQMGAKRIGLIGVDFTDHHFFAKTGRHPLAPRFEKINEQYNLLAKAANALGIEIFNLSRDSRLTAFPKISLDEFENFSQTSEKCEKRASLKIVSYATTPVAGVPAILARCINARTEHSARCVWATDTYGNGVRFAGDVQWREKPELAKTLIAEADLIIAHNGKVASAHQKLFKDKAVVTMAHNYLWNIDEQFVREGFSGVVVGQYQAALPEFKNWSIVPNPMPFWEDEYQPEEKPDRIAICYTPFGKHERYAPEDKLYWHSKGYETTMRILEKLAKQFPVKLEVITNRQISHAESIAMKRRSHIVIDECVTGSYHRNSLEGLAVGCVVVNGLGILPKVVEVLSFCSETAEIPFVPSTLENLEEVLIKLIASGKNELVQKGLKNRAWLEKHWSFDAHWEKFWMPAIEKSLQKTSRNPFSEKPEKISFDNAAANDLNGNSKLKELKKGVSVVIPHGGEKRLPHLRACLANLQKCRDVAEIIIVEMDESPKATEIARKWADKYVFLHRAEFFERARTLNIGSVFAESGFVLWLDNDLLIPPEFISRAADDMRARNLDFLTPYSAIKYLSPTDTEKVFQGECEPDQCRPVNIYSSQMTDGGAGLIRKSFFEQNGGIPGGFRGWGGEDNGWMQKVRLLGKVGRTMTGDQTVFHLYHDLSGGYGGRAHIKANPHYPANFALFKKMRATRSPHEFLKNFPPTPNNLWENARQICFVVGEKAENNSRASNAARELFELFGAQIEIISRVETDKLSTYDAIVFFDCQSAFEFFSKPTFKQFREKTLIVAGEKCALSKGEEAELRECFGVLTIDETFVERLANANIKHWFWKRENAENVNAKSFALALAQPLALLINTTQVSSQPEKPDGKSVASELPVWLYWEGNCPEWIKACQKTIFAHAPNVRLLTPETFDELWTEDRDINLKKLHVAQRADFIRAYLLSHYGGAWIDSDCVVTKSLQPLFEKLRDYDFAAHRERGSYFGNEFMIARKGSRIARLFYEKVSKTLRSGKPFGWCDLGCVPLTEVIKKADAPFFEIECEQIQPICWSEVEPYLAAGNDAEHVRNFNPNAFCYMLSNLMVIKYLSANPRKNLLDEKTFFSYLLRRSNKDSAQNGFIISSNGNGAKSLNIETNNGAPVQSKTDLPIWFYWEGARPEWIEACHRTILAKNPNARFLTPETFDELWTQDRDINLSRLYVAHRADFIRAYLLAKFGGLWLDADCIVMRDLQFLLEKLGEYDFVAHREREGLFTNDLMAAKRESVIAREFYEKIRRVLRRKRAISWRAIGGEPLTEILNKTEARFLEIECERIQPVCWSEPEKFFARGEDAEHLQKLDEKAICYMLSNGAVINYQKKHPNTDLTAENTFFSFLVRRATNGNNPPRDKNFQIQARTNGGNSTAMKYETNLQTLSFYLEMISKIAPQKVLDIDVGLGRWAVLLRDLFESSTDKKDWQMSIEAIVAAKPKSKDLPQAFYNRVRVGALDECLKSLEEKPDLLILGDYLTRDAAFQSEKLLEQTLDFSDYILLNVRRNKNNGSTNAQDLLRYFERHPELVAAYQAKEDSASFVLSRRDPKNLRDKKRMADIFRDMAQTFSQQKEESISGPGSSLKQTAEIRRRLPAMFASIGINSMLDAPCGDHNWLPRVDLKLEKYVGIDVVPSIIEQNQRLYESEIKKFYVSDITKDFLPQCDLILCRDCLVHLSFAEIFAALRNFRASGAKYLLTTTFPKKPLNIDIPTGGWRTLNFELAPFNFPPPQQLINERCPEGNGKFADKSLGLWNFSDISAFIEKD
jgi:mannosyltransferase OCH1-like enzyme